ncbi:DNA-binding protein [Paraburkholderia sp.]|uniref:DNA-binding protein n=1 Tax=Paraburkholderia sp. TaxID=1926495 RepID=UPI0023977352|nr:DNA-binding protein [Paraburkholderia sp.]MDE1181788.1 DNA-binding protein [Paraburkholderia sp.]
MSDAISDEVQLAADLDRLKTAFPKTRDLYREACALLFFRYGITPTANRLYQLVKRGSMSTPVAVLGEFWTELREKSRVRIEHPDLPEELQSAAGDLVATLWRRSSEAADAALGALRVEVDAEKLTAEKSVLAARAELERTEAALEQRTAALLTAQVHIQALEKEQSASDATRRSLESENARLRDEIEARDQALTRAQAEFSRDLQALRADAEQSAERLRASEKRALLEIDRERSTASRLQKELDAATRRAEERDVQQRASFDALQAQLGDARHQAGVLQGRLDAAQATNARHAEDIESLRASLAVQSLQAAQAAQVAQAAQAVQPAQIAPQPVARVSAPRPVVAKKPVSPTSAKKRIRGKNTSK